MWLLVEWSEDTDMYPTYRIIQQQNLLNKKGSPLGKYVRFRCKRNKKKRRAKIVMCSEKKRTIKEYKRKLIKRGRKVKAILSKCMRRCRKQMLSMPAPLVDRSRSRSPHASADHSKSRHDRRLNSQHKPMLRSRSMVCCSSKSSVHRPRIIVYDNTTQTDPTPSTPLHKPTVDLFMLFVRQLHSHFLKLLEKIEELRASRNQNESSRQNESDSSDNCEESENLSQQHLIDILKGLDVNVQVVSANTKHSNENARDSNETAAESNESVLSSDKNARRPDENGHDLDENSLQLDDRDSDNNDNIADGNDYVADENDHVADDIDYIVLDSDDIEIDDNLFADVDMQELEEIGRNENMQVLNEDVPTVVENAQNEEVIAQILDENEPVQPVFAELRQLPSYQEPRDVPVFAAPMQLPDYPEPRDVPVFAEPMQLPGYPEPRVLPIFETTRQLPAFAGPSRPIAAVEPRRSEVLRVPAQSTVPDEPSNSAQRCIYGDEEMVAIGFNRTLVPRRLLYDINWTTYTTATRQLLQAVFPRRVLATHSLSGKSSPAFAHLPAKERLDPRLVDDIVETVRIRCGVEKQWIRGVITTKCNDEARLYRRRQNQNNRNNENQENQEPEADPLSPRRLQQDESSSSSD